jgi:hypothetical protein
MWFRPSVTIQMLVLSWPRWAECLNAISASIVAIFAVVMALLVIRQIRTARKTDRPWILVTDIGNPTSLYMPGTGYIPGVVYRLKVLGNTPARIVNYGFRFHPVSKKTPTEPAEPDLPEIPNYGNQTRIQEIPMTGRTVATGMVIDVRSRLESIQLSAEEFEELKRGDKIMCAYGFIAYKDVYGNGHKTQFCYVYDFAFGGVNTAPDGTVLNPAGFRRGGPDNYNAET